MQWANFDAQQSGPISGTTAAVNPTHSPCPLTIAKMKLRSYQMDLKMFNMVSRISKMPPKANAQWYGLEVFAKALPSESAQASLGGIK